MYDISYTNWGLVLQRIESMTRYLTLDTAIFRYNNKDDLLVVIPNFQRQSPSGDRFYSPVSSVLYVLYGERVEKASRTGHAGTHAGYNAPQ